MGGYPFFDALVRGEYPHPSGTKLPRKKLETLGVNPESLSHLGFIWYRVVTERRTDRITVANTRSAVRYCCRA